MKLPRRPKTLSSNSLIVAVSVFVALFSNVAFFAAAMQTYGISVRSIGFFASLFLFITSNFILVLSAICHRVLVKPLLIAFLLLSAVLAHFSSKYGTIFDYHMWSNVLETDTAEARDLLNLQLILYVAGLGLLPAALLYLVTLRTTDWKTETVARFKLGGAAIATLGIIQIVFGGNYASMMRDHFDLVARVNPTYPLYSAVKLAVRSNPVAVTQTHGLIGTDAEIPSTDVSRDLVIMVVGETARADHWSLNGYSRETNARLSHEDVINFPDFWSCGTFTSWSVPCMFSSLGRAKFTPALASAEDNVLDILQRAGVSVLWRDNNSNSKGVAERVAYEDFKKPPKNPVCDEGECRDEGMLHELQHYIDAQKGDIFIVLHQMGNHGPAYYKRYPKAFEQFTPVCKTNDLGACSSEEINNAYDNAIRYTDYFLSQVIELLKQNDSRFDTAMLYVADHGESLGEYGVYLHGMPYKLAPNAQKHVPAVLWLGSKMKQELELDKLEQRRKQPWSQDNVFATLLGLFEIQSDAYNPQLDLIDRGPINTSEGDARDFFVKIDISSALSVGTAHSGFPPMHTEEHLVHRIGWLRAAVLGANDGIISTASLMIGVASSAAQLSNVMLAGVAGLAAGAMSMAAGEYVSVRSQADAEKADLDREREELAGDVESERNELTQIYIDRGVEPQLARQVAIQLMDKDALAAHARDELGISEFTAARPLQAAATSAASFTTGGIVPIIIAATAPSSGLSIIIAAGSIILLAFLGALGAKVGGANMLSGAARVGFWGAAAMAVTAIVGSLVGANL